MARDIGFPDNVHVGSPAHDELVLRITEKLLAESIPCVNKFLSADPSKRRLRIGFERPVTNQGNGNYKTIVGYWDVVVSCEVLVSSGIWLDVESTIYEGPQRIFIEVKPAIESFGALLRQINLYKQFSGPGKVFVFTPDTQFTEQLESQGISVIVAAPVNMYRGARI